MLIEMLSAIWRFINQQEVSNMSGLLGTGISLYLLRTVKSVRRDFLFAARLPQYQESLQAHASSMNLVINAFDKQSGEITLLLELCRADLQNLEEKLAGAAKNALKNQ